MQIKKDLFKVIELMRMENKIVGEVRYLNINIYELSIIFIG